MNITMNSPVEWPFGSPVVPPNVTTTGQSYPATPGGQVSVDPADVSALLALGFTLGVSVSILGKALNVPVGAQDGIDWPIPINLNPNANFVIYDVIVYGVGPIASNTGSGGFYPGPDVGGAGLGNVSFFWAAPGNIQRIGFASPVGIQSTPAIYLDTRVVPDNWSPATDGAICNIYVLGFQVE